MAGLILGIRKRAAWVAIVGVAGIHVVWKWTGIYDQFVGIDRQIASARYETILLVPFTIGIALLFDALQARPARRSAIALAATVALSAITYVRPYEVLLRPFTADYEYRFLKRHALALPSTARVYILDSPNDDDGLYNAKVIGAFFGSPVSFVNWRERQCNDLPMAPHISTSAPSVRSKSEFRRARCHR